MPKFVADSAQSTGLKWQAASSGALTKIVGTTYSNVANLTVDDCFTATYKKYVAIFTNFCGNFADDLHLQLRYAGPTTQTTDYTYSGYGYSDANTLFTHGAGAQTQFVIDTESGNSDYPISFIIYFRTNLFKNY